MYGLLSKAYNNYRIKDTTKKEGFKGQVSGSNRVADLLDIVFTIFAIVCLYDGFLVRKWSAWFFIMLVIFVLLFGNLFALAVVLYWLIEVRPHSAIASKL